MIQTNLLFILAMYIAQDNNIKVSASLWFFAWTLLALRAVLTAIKVLREKRYV